MKTTLFPRLHFETRKGCCHHGSTYLPNQLHCHYHWGKCRGQQWQGQAMPRSGNAEVRKCRGWAVQRSGGAKVRKCGGQEVQRSGNAEVSKCRGRVVVFINIKASLESVACSQSLLLVSLILVIHCLIHRKEDTLSATSIMLCRATSNQVTRKRCTATIQQSNRYEWFFR